jgi:hypothetical protein
MKPIAILSRGLFALLTLFNFSTFAQSYCASGSSTCENEIQNISLAGESSQIANNSNCTSGGYADYTYMSVYMIPGSSYQGSTIANPQGYFAGQITVWIDWNNDGDFDDTGESVFNSSTSTAGAGAAIPFAVNVPGAAVLAATRMRVKTASVAGPYAACGNTNIGETEDYTINIVSIPPPATAYCPASGGCNGGAQARHISNVAYGTVNNASSCGNGSYTNYSATTSADVSSTGTLNISVNSSAFNGADVMSAYVDWNKDFDFNDPNESIILSGNGGLYTGALTPPAGAAVGSTRLRVAMYWGGNGTYNGCGSRAIGEVEDYAINVTGPAPNCVTNHTPVNNAVDICASTGINWQNDALGGGPSGYKVYFGTTANPALVSNQSTRGYSPGNLSPNTKYYWKVVAYNTTGEATGCAEFNFTTSSLSASISPNPIDICTGNVQAVNGGPTGGPAGTKTHAWTGAGAAKLNANDIQTPNFSSNSPGSFPLIYTVTGPNGCKASDNIIVNVGSSVPVDVSMALTSGSNPSCTGTSLEFTATPTNGGTTPSYSWRVNGAAVASGAVYTSSVLADGDVVDVIMTSSNSCTTTPTATSTPITISQTAGSTPTISISLDTPTNCEGSDVSFTPTTQYEGPNPIYDWLVNGLSTASTPLFIASGLVDGDIVTCNLISDATCTTTPNAASNDITMVFTAKADPVVDVAITQGANPSCTGQLIEFTATDQNGGANPTHEWFVNATSVSASSVFSSSSLLDGDMVTCVLTSDYFCVNSANANSTPLTMSVVSSVTPAVDVNFVQGSDEICEGDEVILEPIPTNEGTAPTYEWFVNGSSVATTPTFTSSSLADQDVIHCVLTSSFPCASNPTATSTSFNMTVSSVPLKPTITLLNDVLTSSATSGNQWMTNGTDIPGATNQSYIVIVDGNYTVRIENDNCDSENSDEIIIQGLGLEESNETFALSVFPNPSTGVFLLSAQNMNNLNVVVYNVMGSIVFKEQLSAKNCLVDLSDFENGVYLLKAASNEQSVFVRIVKK